MATGIGSPSSRLDRDPDHLPLAGRRRRPVRPPAPSRAEPSLPAPDRCEARADAGGAGGAAQQSWPGLPRGVEFNPSDSDLLWHLAAEVGNGLVHRYPFINEFIKTVDDERGFSCAHPQDIPGLKQDGRASYFFHKRINLCNNENDTNISWQKIGNTKSIILDETLQGCKEVFVLYAYRLNDHGREKTDWRLHQYHIINTVKDEGELVVSKIFYKSQNNQYDLAEKAPFVSEQEVSMSDGSREELQVDNRSSDMSTENNGNSQEEMQGEMCADQNKLSSSKDVIYSKGFEPGIQTNDYEETDELDHVSLQERYRILVAEKSCCPATISAGKSLRYHEGASCREDICSMLQEISCAPPIIGSMDDDNNRRSLGEDLSGNSGFLSVSGMPSVTTSSPCEVGCCHDPDTENEINGKTLGTCSELPTTQPTCETEKNQLVDVKSHEIGCFSKDSENELLCGNGGLAEKIPGVKSELTESEFYGLCEGNYINTAEHIETSHTRILDQDGSIAFRSHQRRKRKNASYSTDKSLEEDATASAEGVAYCSHRRRRRKTATDSIEKALDEDAPGLLQILLNRGITVGEIKLYGAEEDDEMVPDCTESNFEDLENIITKLFPQRTSLLKLSVARHEKGEKAIYCLSCLLSLIEQSQYLKFRDCPVEWGWCRDLQSFIFVFRSHNRIVLERPEYGYATYFFEIVQSLPIEWQIRRLVIAMKLSGCGRTALIENRPLMVGEDLTEGEAKVLEEYGWIRNSGLGTMLNYRDRVVHDRWTEKCVTDWRMKIGKLLMTGYAEGQTISTHAPKKLADLLENTEDAEIEIKLEDPF
ncbi:hypothetical protein ACP70R_016732 [Stipagrostis hirtigluma subsp. patula]